MQAHKHTHALTGTHTVTHTYTHAGTHTCIHTYENTGTHARTGTGTHTHTKTHKHKKYHETRFDAVCRAGGRAVKRRPKTHQLRELSVADIQTLQGLARRSF